MSGVGKYGWQSIQTAQKLLKHSKTKVRLPQKSGQLQKSGKLSKLKQNFPIPNTEFGKPIARHWKHQVAIRQFKKFELDGSVEFDVRQRVHHVDNIKAKSTFFHVIDLGWRGKSGTEVAVFNSALDNSWAGHLFEGDLVSLRGDETDSVNSDVGIDPESETVNQANDKVENGTPLSESEVTALVEYVAGNKELTPYVVPPSSLMVIDKALPPANLPPSSLMVVDKSKSLLPARIMESLFPETTGTNKAFPVLPPQGIRHRLMLPQVRQDIRPTTALVEIGGFNPQDFSNGVLRRISDSLGRHVQSMQLPPSVAAVCVFVGMQLGGQLAGVLGGISDSQAARDLLQALFRKDDKATDEILKTLLGGTNGDKQAARWIENVRKAESGVGWLAIGAAFALLLAALSQSDDDESTKDQQSAKVARALVNLTGTVMAALAADPRIRLAGWALSMASHYQSSKTSPPEQSNPTVEPIEDNGTPPETEKEPSSVKPPSDGTDGPSGRDDKPNGNDRPDGMPPTSTVNSDPKGTDGPSGRDGKPNDDRPNGTPPTSTVNSDPKETVESPSAGNDLNGTEPPPSIGNTPSEVVQSSQDNNGTGKQEQIRLDEIDVDVPLLPFPQVSLMTDFRLDDIHITLSEAAIQALADYGKALKLDRNASLDAIPNGNEAKAALTALGRVAERRPARGRQIAEGLAERIRSVATERMADILRALHHLAQAGHHLGRGAGEIERALTPMTVK